MIRGIKLFLFFGLALFGAVTSYGASVSSDSIVAHWNNEEEMKPYFTALSKFRAVFEASLEKEADKPGNEFKKSPTPNPFFHRLPKHMVLRLNMIGPDQKTLDRFYSPFGEVSVLGSGFQDSRISITEDALATMEREKRWVLEDVTEKIKWYRFILRDNGTEELKEEHLVSPNQRFFLVKSFDDHVFVSNSPEEIVIFSSLSYMTNQYERDRALFEKLSDGKNCF